MAKATAPREKAIKAAKYAGMEPPDLEPLAVEAMPRHGLARKADGTPTSKAQRNFTHVDSHLTKTDGHSIQDYNYQPSIDSSYQAIVAVGLINKAPDVEHLKPAGCSSTQKHVYEASTRRQNAKISLKPCRVKQEGC